LLMANDRTSQLLPSFVRTCRNLNQFWSFIKAEHSTYEARRRFIWDAFGPLLDKLEGQAASPVDASVSDTLESLDVEHVSMVWQRAIQRRMQEPDAAITSARTLIESVCKLILDDLGGTYSDGDSLPKLYRSVAQQLNLAPDQHTEEVFKQILGGCTAVVEGLGSVRNKLGDAHGTGKGYVKPDSRHAELVVNLAGAMAVFLVRTWEHRKNRPAAISPLGTI
jgi:hypothetical protein